MTRIERAVAFTTIAAASLFLDCCKATPDDRIIQRDTGVLCVGAERSDAAAGELRVDQAVPIIVKTPGCLDACTRDRTAKCSVKREGDKLLVSSEIAWHGPEDIGQKCKGACTVMEASCATPGLSAGTYTVELGETKTKIEVPSRLARPCVDGTPPPVVAVAPPPSAPTALSTLPPPPATAPAVAPPPPGDEFCITPFGSTAKGKSSLAVTLTRPNPCTAASCTAAKAKCTIKKDKNNRLVVTSTLPVVEKAKPRKPCTEDCPKILASCRLDGLAPGSYTIESGATKQPVQVPVPKEICLP